VFICENQWLKNSFARKRTSVANQNMPDLTNVEVGILKISFSDFLLVSPFCLAGCCKGNFSHRYLRIFTKKLTQVEHGIELSS